MRKNFNVIQINGFRGILIALFVVSCLIAGFGAFPGFLAMSCWNFTATYVNLPLISLPQGILLWAIIALSYFTFKKKKFIVSFRAQDELNEEELKHVVEKIKMQSIARANIEKLRNEAIKNIQLREKFEIKEDSNLSETTTPKQIEESEKELCTTNEELKG